MTEKDSGQRVPLEKLEKTARNLAEHITPGGSIRGAAVAGAVLSGLRSLKGHHRRAVRLAAECKTVPGEMEWLLDNWYIAEREGKEAAMAFQGVSRLRREREGALLMGLARTFVQTAEGAVTSDGIHAFFGGLQQVCALDEREVSLLIPAICGALIFRLEKLAARINTTPTEGLSDDMGRIFSSLRLLVALDATDILDEISQTEQTLRHDPAGVYDQMDEKTRARYRERVSLLAKRHRLGEHQVAEQVLELARIGKDRSRHVGYYLFVRPLGKRGEKRRGGLYIGGILLSSLFFSLLAAVLLERVLIAVLLVLPISEIIKNLVDFFVIKFVRPAHVPRLKLDEGVPQAGRTLCVISALLDSESGGKALADQLEEYYLANRDCGKNLIFGLLADFPETEHPVLTGAKEWVSTTQAALGGLNKKYGERFLLFTRERTFNEKSGRYMGWERKRGAILELTRLLTGKPGGIQVTAGSKLLLEGVRYVITLDSDTRLNVGAAREMIGAMLHPLNTPVIDAKRGVVTEGTGLMQPRIGVDLTAASRSDFTRIFAGQGGIDPYGSAASDVYQDLFSEGSFTGKGIFDVAAFSACLDQAFPEDAVLSHDLLEGGYLRAAYLGDVELTDGYPYKVLSYFARLHRWTRGDWQSAPWLFAQVTTADGRRVQNPLSRVGRWKIFDNLRRSMVSVFTLSALLAAMLTSLESLFWAGIVAVLSPLSALLISSAELLLRRDPGTRARYHSTIISGFAGGFLETISQLILLPYHAYISLSGALTALWRMGITRRNMLSWVTAAHIEQGLGSGLLHHYYKMLPAVIVALAVIALSGTAPKIAVGIVWLLSPLYALSISRERQEPKRVTDTQRAYLQACAQEIWQYFEDFLTPQDHFLPPDNWQEQPAVGTAHRTSPTNIGLGLLSALSAMDLGLCPKHRALGYIENMLATIERMEKWNGHLYNWYDTRTLRPLRPVYVSTVDSGNLAGCLLVLREGLYEMGQRELGIRADKLFSEMSFTELYDRRRKLFYIGWDLDRGTPTEGWYDLLASEARQASYIAIAKGDVEPRHWRRLGRSLVSQDNYSGMASWTGSMFEYFMPNLIMPCYQNSLLYESLKFCVYVQKRRHSPWGVSESAFYAFDPALNYSYKAHGVQRLALRRGMNKEIVVSPYSSFLALLMDVRAAVQNLRRLEQYGARGKYGFYEALDFTPNRSGGRGHRTVKTYMAHHLGMSLLAITGLLTENAMQKRFMQDRAMAAYRELLQEKVPVGQIVLRQPPREVPDKPHRITGGGWSAAYENPSVFHPAATMLSNGAYSVMVTETGHTRSMAGETMTTRFIPRQDGPTQGMGFYWKTTAGITPLQMADGAEADASCSALFTGNRAELSVSRSGLESVIAVSVPQSEMGEMRQITLRNKGGAPIEGELICYAEPVLAAPADYFAHPAFLRLSMETEAEGRTLIVRRRGNGVRPDSYLAFSVSADFAFDTSREAALGRSGLYAAMGTEAQGTKGTVLDPCLFVRVPVRLKPGEGRRISFALATGGTWEEAVSATGRILAQTVETGQSFVEKKAAALGMPTEEITEAMASVPALVYPFLTSAQRGRFITPQSVGQQELWPYGISGDLPIITARIDTEGEMDLAQRLIRRHGLLLQCGLPYDLALLVQDGGDYRRPVHTGIRNLLANMGLEGYLGARGGVHLLDGTGDCTAILAASAQIMDGAEHLESRDLDHTPPRREPEGMTVGIRPKFSWGQDNTVVIETGGDLPPNAWSQMLANETYGYIATDCGTGHMWQTNARENQITPWRNDTLETNGPERLILLRDGREISLFADADGIPCTITYGFGFARWEKSLDGGTITATAFVPPDTEARVFLVEGAFQPGDEIAYFAELVLGADDKNRAYVVTAAEENTLSARNGSNGAFPGVTFSLAASVSPKGYTCDRQSWARRTLDARRGAGMDPCFYAVYPTAGAVAIVAGTQGGSALSALADPPAARKALAETIAWWRSRIGGISVRTGVEALDQLLSGWALYQTLACRIMGRSSVYQSGGAYGFRDQLQDVTALIPVLPEQAKRQLLLAAARQFEEGDVQHWWHPSGIKGAADKGVRTRCSDDLLFLPYVLCEYVEKTGDLDVCQISVPYIRSPILEKDEHERYESPAVSDLAESLFLHAKRAVDLTLQRGAGRNGLALMGTGDWNDGMNLVGAAGRGESIWLTWFLAHVLERFSHLCARLEEPELAQRYAQEAERCGRAADSAWDGDWYLRGTYDSGATLGSRHDKECQIDAIAQGFAAMTRHSDPRRVETAITSAIGRLFDRQGGIVRLFTPSFTEGEKNPGYIRGYAPGVRENGGQYTHGCLWLVMGAFLAGMAEEGYDMLRAMLPGEKDTAVYRGEPYVLAADVYGNPQHVGRAGWTWYTGAAGWYWRVAMENLLGLRLRDGKLYIEPNLPSQMEGYSVDWQTGETVWRIQVEKSGGYRITVNGEPYTGEGIELHLGKLKETVSKSGNL